MKNIKKSFVICPVRGANLSYQEPIIKHLETDFQVYWPARDTHQNDPIGLAICQENLKAMQDADVVHIIWDGKSQGSLFDLGMAFALGKWVVPIELTAPTSGKSFQNMINAWKVQQPLVPLTGPTQKEVLKAVAEKKPATLRVQDLASKTQPNQEAPNAKSTAKSTAKSSTKESTKSEGSKNDR